MDVFKSTSHNTLVQLDQQLLDINWPTQTQKPAAGGLK